MRKKTFTGSHGGSDATEAGWPKEPLADSVNLVPKGFMIFRGMSPGNFVARDFCNDFHWIRMALARQKCDPERKLREGIGRCRTWHQYVQDEVVEWNRDADKRLRIMLEHRLEPSDCSPMDEGEAFRIMTGSPEAVKLQDAVARLKALAKEKKLDLDGVKELADEIMRISGMEGTGQK